MTMHVLDRPGIARRVAKTFATIGAVAAVLAGLTAFSLPASAKTNNPTYNVRTILSGKSLHHWYYKAGSKKRHSEPLTLPDDITRIGNDLFTGFQNGVGPQGQASTDGNSDSTIVEFTLSGVVVNQKRSSGPSTALDRHCVPSHHQRPSSEITTGIDPSWMKADVALRCRHE